MDLDAAGLRAGAGAEVAAAEDQQEARGGEPGVHGTMDHVATHVFFRAGGIAARRRRAIRPLVTTRRTEAARTGSVTGAMMVSTACSSSALRDRRAQAGRA
jgi:hypothetical protein